MYRRIIYLAMFAFSAMSNAQQAKPIYLDDSKPIEEHVENALSKMTLDEKIAMIHAQSKFSSPGVPRLGIPITLHSELRIATKSKARSPFCCRCA